MFIKTKELQDHLNEFSMNSTNLKELSSWKYRNAKIASFRKVTTPKLFPDFSALLNLI